MTQAGTFVIQGGTSDIDIPLPDGTVHRHRKLHAFVSPYLTASRCSRGRRKSWSWDAAAATSPRGWRRAEKP